jgi:hypothetical protein
MRPSSSSESRQRKNARRRENNCYRFLVSAVETYPVIYGDQRANSPAHQPHVLAELLHFGAYSPQGRPRLPIIQKSASLLNFLVLKTGQSIRTVTLTNVFRSSRGVC